MYCNFLFCSGLSGLQDENLQQQENNMTCRARCVIVSSCIDTDRGNTSIRRDWKREKIESLGLDWRRISD